MNKEKLIKNTTSNVFFRIMVMALGIITAPIVVKAVGKEEFGFILLAGTITGYFSLLGFGLPGAIVKYVSEYMAKKDNLNLTRVINSTLFVFVVVGVFISIFIILSINLGALSLFNITPDKINSAKNVFYIASILALFSWPANVVNNAIEGLQEYHKVNIINFVTRIIGITATITFALLGFSIEIIYLASNLGLIISWFWKFIYLRRSLPFWRINLNEVHRDTLKMLVGFSLWMLLLQISSLLTYQTDKIIISTMLPVSMLTVYYVLYKPIEIIKTLTSFLRIAIMPAASELHSTKGLAGLKGLIYRASRYFVGLNAPLTIIGLFLSKPFIELWMGYEYTEYIYVTQIYCASLLLLQTNGLLGEVYFGTGKVKRVAILAIIISVFNVILSIILVKSIGFPGVLIATLIAQLIERIFQYIIMFPQLEVKKKYYFLHVILGSQWPSYLLLVVLLPFWNLFNLINTWTELIIVGVTMALAFYIFIYTVVIDKKEKELIKAMAYNFIKKK